MWGLGFGVWGFGFWGPKFGALDVTSRVCGVYQALVFRHALEERVVAPLVLLEKEDCLRHRPARLVSFVWFGTTSLASFRVRMVLESLASSHVLASLASFQWQVSHRFVYVAAPLVLLEQEDCLRHRPARLCDFAARSENLKRCHFASFQKRMMFK